MPVADDGSLLLEVHHDDWRGKNTTQEEFVFGYRPTAGADRRVRVFTKHPGIGFHDFLLAYVVTGEGDPLPVASFDATVALRFRDWLSARLRRHELQPETMHEFGRRRFTTVSNGEAIALAAVPLQVGDRNGAYWRGRLPLF